MQVDELSEVGYVLRRFVGDSGYIVLKNQQGCGMPFIAVGREFLNIDYGSIGDPPYPIQPLAALALEFIGPFWFPAKEKITGGDGACTAKTQHVKTKWKHDLGRVSILSIKLASRSRKRLSGYQRGMTARIFHRELAVSWRIFAA